MIGWRPLTHTFDPASVDVATICILILGAIGIGRALIERRDYFVELAILQLGNILFIAVMKFVYTYHFEITILLMLPFVAAEMERISTRSWSVVATALLLATGVNIFASVFRGKEADLAYQDLIMREGDETKPEPAGTRIISEKVALQVSKMLEGVLEPGGTASEVSVPGHQLAGKTDRSRNWLVVRAIEDFVALNGWQLEKIEAGIAGADRGEFASDEELARVKSKFAPKA